VILEFEEVFWDNLSHFFIPYDPEMNAWVDITNLQFFNENKAPVLISSIHSELYQKHFTDDQLVEHYIKLIRNIYPNSFKPLKNSWVTDWDLDPFTLGSYSYHPEGSSLDDNSEIARPLGCLIFVGEHTNRSPSNVQGAYISGMAGAKQVVEQLYYHLDTNK
jgi:monoamine oxidase